MNKAEINPIKTENAQSQTETENINSQILSFIKELPNQGGYIDFNQLQSAGHGGTHDVYIYPKNSSFVIKLDRGVLKKTLRSPQKELSPEMHQIAEKHVNDQSANYEQLYKYFKEEHCLREKIVMQKIRVEQKGEIHDIEGLISIQKTSDVFKNPNKKDFSTSYAEKILSKEDKEVYNNMNYALLSEGEFKAKDFLKFNEKLLPIFELIDENAEFANSMKEFLSSFKKYFEASGRFIDLVGEENVLFYQKNNKWTFQLSSVLKAETKHNVEEALKILEKNPDQLNSELVKEKSHLLNGLALVRMLNAAGIKTGMGKIINITLSEKQLQNLEKVKFSKQKNQK